MRVQLHMLLFSFCFVFKIFLSFCHNAFLFLFFFLFFSSFFFFFNLASLNFEWIKWKFQKFISLFL